MIYLCNAVNIFRQKIFSAEVLSGLNEQLLYVNPKLCLCDCRELLGLLFSI